MFQTLRPGGGGSRRKPNCTPKRPPYATEVATLLLSISMSKLDCEGRAFRSLSCVLLDPQAVANRIEANVKTVNADFGIGYMRAAPGKKLENSGLQWH